MTGTDRRGVPLRLLIFGITAGLVALAVGLAIGLSLLQGQRLSERLVGEALDRARAAGADLRALRFRELELVTQLMADDPYFTNVVAEATGGGLFGEGQVSTTSLVDQLEELRERIGFDMAFLLDPEGVLLAHSERPVAPAEWQGDRPLVRSLLESLRPVAGYSREGEDVYQVVLVPIAKASVLIGFVAAGIVVDDRFAAEISRVSGTEQILLAEDRPIASTLPTDVTRDVLTAVRAEGAVPGPSVIELGEGRWAGAVERIDEGGALRVAAVSLIATDRVLATYRELLGFLVAGGVLIVLLGLAVSLWLARRLARPLTRLAEVAANAVEGEFEQDFGQTSGVAEVGRLGQAFGTLMGELREKRDMQEYVSDLDRYLPDPGIEETRAAARTHAADEATREMEMLLLLAMEFPAMNDPESELEAIVATSERIGQRLTQLLRAAGGRLEHFAGQRALASFTGSQALERLLVVASRIVVGQRRPALALVAGRLGRATVRLDGTAHRLVLGQAALDAERLLDESRDGALLVPPTMKGRLAGMLRKRPGALHVTSGCRSGRKQLAVALEKVGPLPLPAAIGATALAGDRLRVVGATATFATGDLVGRRYEIVALLGRGGMGAVYKAYDRELEDFVALKTLLPEVAADGQYLDQLKAEIKLARRVTHPAVLRTFDFGMHGRVPYISMEYVRGMTLRYLLDQRRRLPFSAALRILRQLAQALAAAHAQDVVHRDVKPENVILHASGNAKLMDFGIASRMQRLDAASEDVFVGTPLYAAPEQMLGRPLDARADVYACGVLLYEVFAGRRPFAGDLASIYQAKREQTFTPFGEVAIIAARGLAPIVDRCLAPNPADRYPDGAALAAALQAFRG